MRVWISNTRLMLCKLDDMYDQTRHDVSILFQVGQIHWILTQNTNSSMPWSYASVSVVQNRALILFLTSLSWSCGSQLRDTKQVQITFPESSVRNNPSINHTEHGFHTPSHLDSDCVYEEKVWSWQHTKWHKNIPHTQSYVRWTETGVCRGTRQYPISHVNSFWQHCICIQSSKPHSQ